MYLKETSSKPTTPARKVTFALSQMLEAGYAVLWLTTLAEIDAFRGAWRQLDATSTAELVWFQSFEWCRNWIALHANIKEQPRILVLLDGELPVAILPLILKRAAFGARMLEIIGLPHTQYANALRAQSEADAAVFSFVPAGSALAQILEDVSPSHALANVASMLSLNDLGEGKSFESTRSAHAQKRLRRHVRLFEKEFEGLVFETLRPGSKDYASRISECIELKKQWLKTTGKMGSGLIHFDHAAFLSTLKAYDTDDGPVLWVLRGTRKLIAVEVGFLQRGHYYCYMSSFDPDLWKLSPGKLQKAMTINALAEMGAKTFDLMGNPTGYKDDYADTHVALRGYVVNLTTQGAVYTRTWTEHLEPAVRRLFYRMPNGLRQGIAAARRLSFS